MVGGRSYDQGTPASALRHIRTTGSDQGMQLIYRIIHSDKTCFHCLEARFQGQKSGCKPLLARSIRSDHLALLLGVPSSVSQLESGASAPDVFSIIARNSYATEVAYSTKSFSPVSTQAPSRAFRSEQSCVVRGCGRLRRRWLDGPEARLDAWLG